MSWWMTPWKGMATHSSILTWRIPWTEEPGRLQSMRLQRVRHNWATNTHTQWMMDNGCVCFILHQVRMMFLKCRVWAWCHNAGGIVHGTPGPTLFWRVGMPFLRLWWAQRWISAMLPSSVHLSWRCWRPAGQPTDSGSVSPHANWNTFSSRLDNQRADSINSPDRTLKVQVSRVPVSESEDEYLSSSRKCETALTSPVD